MQKTVKIHNQCDPLTMELLLYMCMDNIITVIASTATF